MGYTGSNPTTIFSRLYKSDNLPPMTVPKKVKKSKKWQRAVLDGFEHEAIQQFQDNLQFIDLYRMVDGKLSYQELSEVAPHMKDIQSLLDGVGVPSFLRHYDIIGVIINAIVGYYSSMQPKFHITDTGEVAENEFLRHQNKRMNEILKKVIQNEVDLGLAKMGFSQEGKKFNSPEEQQQYIQQLEQAKKELTPEDTKKSSEEKFKTIGMKWGEATLQRDKERFNLHYLDRENLKDQQISGRCFRHFRIGHDDYEPEVWSAKNTFFSREVDAQHAHKGQYIGRLNIFTPSQVIERYGHEIPTNKQKEILGGNESWKSFAGDGNYSGSIENAITSNFNKQVRVPFSNYHDYNFYLGLQEETGIPLGTQTIFNDDGSTSERDRFLPRLMGDYHGRYAHYGKIMRDDYRQRLDLCQVTEVYFRAYDLYGYLTYEDETGATITEEVTEDILKDFLKENGIKQTYKESLVDIVREFKPNTLQWVYRPVTYEGVKIQSENLTEPLYLHCRPCEHQIKGDSEFDRWLPVAGWIGESTAKKVEPYQAKYNLCMNQIYSLLEKEVGIFFLLDTAMIPSEFEGWGDAQEALIAMRNIAKDTGILPISTSGDSQRNNTNFNQVSSYNLSYTSQISDRIRLAEFAKQKAYELIGINPSMLQSPSKYETAEGVKQSQEATFAQISDIYDSYHQFVRSATELHLSVAQYCQSNNKDLTIHYTKSDGSIEFLKFSDPEFPFRRLGLVPSQDGEKRKELNQFKQYLLSTNTLGADTMEIAKLISSDAMSEAIEIASAAQKKREEQERAKFQRDQALQAQKAKAEKELSEEEWLREEESNKRDRENDLNRERIKALGRASDKQSDVEGFEQINKEADRAIKENDLNFKAEVAQKNYQLQEKKLEEEKKVKMEKLKLEARKLEERVKDRRSKEYIAEINKN